MSGPAPTREEVLAEIHRLLAERSIPVPFCGCLIWTGGATKGGYGVFRKNGRAQYAHRASFELRHGPIPPGMMVLHKCDVPACINSDHLMVGGNIENRRDQISKGRDIRGERHGVAKLSDLEVTEIRADQRCYSTIAQSYGVTKHTIWRIKKHRTRVSRDVTINNWPRTPETGRAA